MASANCTWVRPRCRRSSANRLPKSEGYAFLAITPAILSPLAPQPGRAVASISRVMYTLADGILAAREVTRNAFSLLTAFWRKRVLMIEQAEIDRVKQSTDLAALIRARGVTLKRKGKQLVGLCPFHDDHEPSLIVDPKKQLWNCLGSCSEGGDVYKWVMKSEGIGFREAHERLVLMSHTPAVEVEKGEVETPDFVASAADLIWLERATAHYHRRMLETPSAKDYLRSRGITAPEIVSAFRLGYADGTLLQVISAEGRGALKRIGLITESGRELLGGCVVFPLVDARNNEVISLYGRDCGKEEKLYLPGERDRCLRGVERRRPQRHSGLRDERTDRRDHHAFAGMPRQSCRADARCGRRRRARGETDGTAAWGNRDRRSLDSFACQRRLRVHRLGRDSRRASRSDQARE